MKHYLMYPDIHGNRIAFVTEDDLWYYDGSIKRITEGLGVVKYPRFSSDGLYIAFSVFRSMGREDIKPQGDIYVYSIETGALTRLTYLGSKDIRVVGWYGCKIYFSSSHSSPLNYYQEIYRMSPDGSDLEKLPYGNASYIGFGSNFTLLGRNTGDPARWKRYRGGTVGQLWVSSDGKNFRRILNEINGNIGSPMVVGEKICFISDHEGVGRIYCLDGNGIIGLTDNKEYYARNASTDGNKIIFQMAGDIYVYDGSIRKIDLDIYGTKRGLQERFVENVQEKIESFSLGENGEKMLLTIRGKFFDMGSFDGPVMTTPGIRLMNGKYMKDGFCVGVLDSGGRESIVIVKDGRIADKFDIDVGLIYNIWPLPDGKRIAFSNNRLELNMLDLEKRAVERIDQSRTEPIEDLDFSPDGKWIAYTIGISYSRSKIRIRNLATNEFSDINSTYRLDFSPSFDPLGRFLYFISVSGYKAVEDLELPLLSFPNPSKIFLVTLKKSIKDPFIEKVGEEKEFSIDLEGISERVVPFPLREGRYYSLTGVKDGIVYMSRPLKMEEGEGEIHHYSIEKRKDEVLVEKCFSYVPSLDRSKIAYVYRGMLRIVDSMQKQEMKSTEPGRESGIIDMGRIKLSVSPAEEFLQMFRETWLMMRENYWRDENIDWDGIFKKYNSLLDRVSTRSELSDLIWEMQGELGTSHSYEMLGDYFNSPLETRGYLGAEIESQNFTVKKIYRGRLDERSPLLSPGVDVLEGDRIVSINGMELGAMNTPGKLLTNMVKDVVRLKTRRGDMEREFSVRTIGDESLLIYRDWVENNKRIVHEKTGGRVGYVHIPDMMHFGFAEFHKNYLEESDRDALIIDVRYNRGGFVSWMLLEKLNRKIIGYDHPRHGLRQEYPPYSPKGPLVCITNELSGSDGDIFSHSFKLMKLGTLIGRRTWGGVIGINPRRKLIDGSVVTQPEYAFWFTDVGFGVENRGTEPDIDVEIAPQDFAEGRDTQLERAISTAIEMLSKKDDKKG